METLNLSEQLVIQDLEEYVTRILPKEATRKKQVGGVEDDLFNQQDFFRYLVSVASHPIGLRASVKPFNNSEEDMLNYLVDVFDIQDFERLKKILISYRDTDAAKDRVDPAKLAQIIRSRRRHSWRPELRIRIKPPTFYYRERHYIDNLSVRVYLFKEDSTLTIKPDELVSSTSSDTSVSSRNQRTVLNNIFRTNRIDVTRRIRPVNELRCLVNFRQVPSLGQDLPGYLPKYKMVRTIDGVKMDGDIHLRIRRRYCDPGSKYILRFEFWIDSEAIEANWYAQSRRYLKRIVFNGPSTCAGGSKSAYDNEDKEFYGYVNYKLSDLPSHAIKVDRPVVTLQSRKMNNCEICIEAKNRRLETDENDLALGPGTNKKAVELVSNQDFIINHIRLYANCLLYQSLQLIETRGDSLIGSYIMDNVTIDRLVYTSAQTLINQHRLQSNLSRSEDQTLRRIACILIINSLQSKFRGHEKNANMIQNLLISLAKNEYATARKVIDDKTMQEMDPFFSYPPSHTSNMIVEMELSSLRRFTTGTLKERIKKHFLPRGPKDDLNRVVTLNCLTMLKRALTHYEKISLLHADVKNIRFDIGELSDFVTKLLKGSLEKFITMRFNALLDRTSTSDDDCLLSKSSMKSSFLEGDSWPKLLRDIRSLSNDVNLYWSSKGIEGLDADEERVSRRVNFDQKQGLSKLIKFKIDDFLD